MQICSRLSCCGFHARKNKRALHLLQHCSYPHTSYFSLMLFHGGKIMRQRTVTLFLLFSFLLATAAWGREDKLANTGAAPAAEGKVITDTDRNGNTGIEVHVKHMATPQSLTPAKQTYLVWVQPRGKDPELLGALRVNEDLEGSLKAATTYKDFEIFITAEDNMKPDTPSSTVILKGSVARK
jgi:hypothetical protein